jgi:transposase-like protein
LGVQLVDSLEGSAPAKEKLKVVLETMVGTKTVSEACAELGLGETALRELRGQALQELVRLMEPRPPGRPKQEALPREQEVAALQAENQELRLKLRGLQIREEIAVAMPHLLKGRSPEGHGGEERSAAALKKTTPPPASPPLPARRAPPPGR